jgi:MFS family permease
MAGLGSVIGLLLGGALTTCLSWRRVLFINVPRTLVSGQREHGSIDVPGTVTATLAACPATAWRLR